MLEPRPNVLPEKKKFRESISRYFSVFGVVLLYPIVMSLLLQLFMYAAPPQIYDEHAAILLALVLVFSCFFWGYMIACAAGKNNWKPAIFGLVAFTAILLFTAFFYSEILWMS